MMTSHGDGLGTDRSQRHWRLVTVQAGGGLTVVRQKTRRSTQQLHLAGFLAKHSCTVAGIGDTRLGDDISSFTTSVKHAAHAEHARVVEEREGSNAATSVRPVTSSWYSSGSSADRNGVWRGGVATGSYGEAQQRLHGHITDCRGAAVLYSGMLQASPTLPHQPRQLHLRIGVLPVLHRTADRFDPSNGVRALRSVQLS